MVLFVGQLFAQQVIGCSSIGPLLITRSVTYSWLAEPGALEHNPLWRDAPATAHCRLRSR